MGGGGGISHLQVFFSRSLSKLTIFFFGGGGGWGWGEWWGGWGLVYQNSPYGF